MEIAIFWFVMAIVVAAVADRKGRSAIAWFFLGLLFWPIALIHALVMPKNEYAVEQENKKAGRVQCPDCAEWIMAKAKICPHCKSDFTIRAVTETNVVHQAASKPQTALSSSISSSQPEPPEKVAPSTEKMVAIGLGVIAVLILLIAAM